MWWMALLQQAQRAGQDRREREREGMKTQAPTRQDVTGLSGGINASAAFDGDVGRDQNDDREQRRSRWGSFGRGIAQRYLSGGG